MTEESQEKADKRPTFIPEVIPETGEIAYNEDEGTPGGLKVRWKIRIATGKEAERVRAAQAEAIRELQAWKRAQQARQRSQASRGRRSR